MQQPLPAGDSESESIALGILATVSQEKGSPDSSFPRDPRRFYHTLATVLKHDNDERLSRLGIRSAETI